MNKYTLPAGMYYIGDPCYVYNHKEGDVVWQKIIKDFFKVENRGTKELQHIPTEDLDFYMAGTTHGDGVYPIVDKHIENLVGYAPVDAGIISIVRIDNINKEAPYFNQNGFIDEIPENTHYLYNSFFLGLFVYFAKEFEVSAVNGTFKFGHLIIRTDFEDY